MRIGIISDIHGGLRELHSALAFLQKMQVDHVLCAGDLVDFGDFGDEVVKQIFAGAIPCVQGNHDRMAWEFQRLRQRKQNVDGVTKILKSETLDLLEQLPLELRYMWSDTSILLTHATPWGEDMYVYPESTLPLFRRVVREANADITILGHTHRPMWVEVDGGMIINPGSLSQNYFLDVGTFGILTIPDRRFQLFSVESGDELEITPTTYLAK